MCIQRFYICKFKKVKNIPKMCVCAKLRLSPYYSFLNNMVSPFCMQHLHHRMFPNDLEMIQSVWADACGLYTNMPPVYYGA